MSSTAAGRGARIFWRTLDVAGWGFLAYDLLSSSDPAIKQAAKEKMAQAMIPDTVKRALAADSIDHGPLSHAFTTAGLSLLSTEGGEKLLVSLAHVKAGDYIRAHPDRPRYSAEKIRSIMAIEFDGMVAELINDAAASGASDESQSLGPEISALEVVDALGIDEDNPINLRVCDFLIYLFESVAEEEEVQSSAVGQKANDTPSVTVSPGKPLQ